MNISEKAQQLIKDQQKDWDLARVNYAGLKSVEERRLAFEGFDLLVQFNPKRIRSSAAKVDALSIEARPCFLCRQNLPHEQTGIPFGDHYLILVNPFPIFNEHLTITHIHHTDQRIADKFMDMLSLAKALEYFTVFYNGPKCGASAPDHFHFQAGNKGFMPIERDYKKGSFFHDSYEKKGVEIIVWTDYLRPVLTLSGRDPEALNGIFQSYFNILKSLQPQEPEPMINILASWQNSRWAIHLFPRKLHRPWQFFESDEKQILLSPASVDLGGVLITPRDEDFMKISMADAKDILEQVCLDETVFRATVKDLISKL
ncbi:MAG: DUF4922 domain-containing protein [Cyclobacteriaceae bacterium]|nr:DUF4922 domain-containing protein [Cyclobacteriaceae bacterium]